MLATWLCIYVSILFPVPVVSKTRLLRNLLIDYCEFAINASSGKTMYKVYGMHVIRCVGYSTHYAVSLINRRCS